MIKRFLVIFLLTTVVFCSAYRKPYKYEIKAEKNAFYHNTLGLDYLKDRVYYAAIQEFKIAISLSPSTQASAIFYNNLGETYNFIGYPEQALPCFEDAIKLYGLNFKYYLNLVDTYIALNKSEYQVQELLKSDNIFDRIKLGIFYIKLGDVRKGVNILDEVCITEPDLLITPAIKQYINESIKDIQ
jgi:tetratricopeptide (TPR) repeat protein